MATIHPITHEFDPIEDPPSPGLRLSEEEFVAWCVGHPGVRAEWVDGEISVMSPGSTEHVDLYGFLNAVMRGFVEQHDLGRVYGPELIARFRAGERLLRRLPDVLFVSSTRLHLLRPTYLDGPPDLVVEIVSPESVARDWREKYLEYEAAGVREYWVIDPLTRNVEASRRVGEAFSRIVAVEGRVASEVLPGFFLRPDWLWREPLPKVRDVLRDLGV
ncbi:MAG: Uma2 family endonuclease [Isosphaeraceae bacterium]